MRRAFTSLLIAAVGVACASDAARASVPDGFYGVNAQDLLSGSSSSWSTQLSAMAAGGLQAVRTDVRWWTVEPSPPRGSTHSYDWSRYDTIVQALASHGLRWYPILSSAPDWAAAGGDDPTPSGAHIADFGQYAFAFAQRYGRGGSFWQAHRSLTQLPVTDYEVWNEENSSTFWPSLGDAPERYADAYVAARAAIRAVDPHARVVTGGLALSNPPNVLDELDFLRRMLARHPELIGNVDAVGLHPYQPTVADTFARIARVRQGIDQLFGSALPIDITEVGWSTTAVSDTQRASDLAKLAVDLAQSDCGIQRFLPYSWLTRESDGSNPEDWFGIWNSNGSPKASGTAYLQAVQRMRAAAAPGTMLICGPPPDASARPPGPRLRLRTRVNRPRRRLKVRARCPQGCTLSVRLLKRHGAKRKHIARRSKHFSSRTWRLHLRIPHRARRLELRVVALGNGGGRTSRIRHIRLKR